MPGSQIPNNTFGWGRIDALASVSMVDLGILIVDSPDPVAVGGQLTYTVSASNSGVVTATNVSATVTLSPLVSFVSAASGCSHAAGVVTCSFGSVAKGTFPSKSIVVTVVGGGTIQSSGSITGTLYDFNSGNNQTFVTTLAGSGADLKLTMSGAWDPALAGAPFAYTLTAQNLGPAAAGNVTLTDTLPSGAAFSSASAGCTPGSGTVTCNLGTLNSGTSSVVSITIIPSTAVSVTNGAVVAGDSVDPNPANNSAGVTTGVAAALPVSLEVDAFAGGGVGSDANGVFEPGEQVVVNPSWQNPSAGPAAFTGAASSFLPVSVAGGTYTIADAAASYGSIGAGATGRQPGGDGRQLRAGRPRSRRAPGPALGRPVHRDAVHRRRPDLDPASRRLVHRRSPEPLGLPVRRDDSPQWRHRRMRRHDLLSGQLAHARRDGGSSPEVQARPGLGAPAFHGNGLHRRPDRLLGG